MGLSSIRKVLVANRGEIAARCIRACSKLGLQSVSIYTPADSTSLHVSLADESVLLKTEGVAGYLDVDNIIEICQAHNVDAVIPGYGFLSENASFAQKVADAGMVFVGPSPESITAMGLKHRARELAIATGVPVVPGTELLESEQIAVEEAEKLGFPVMLKATGGGGGMGLQVCFSAEDVRVKYKSVQSRGETLFKNAGVFLEKYYSKSRHVEVQVFGGADEVVHFGERECSIQRRHQKVIEECPSPFVESKPGMREKLTTCAVNYASALNYKSAGTVEFLVDDETGSFFFLEMNTRLQVEHGITELCYGVDLVELMLLQADGERHGTGGIPIESLRLLVKDGPDGSAIEVRIYAENPSRNFAPSPGILQEVVIPVDGSLRVDTWVKSGQEITSYFDPLIAKVMVHASTRAETIIQMTAALAYKVSFKGPANNLDFVKRIIASSDFGKGNTLTTFLDTFPYRPCAIDVLSAGAFTTVQDVGRPKKGHGIPKSGPMDSISARIANILVGNDQDLDLLEITLDGPELVFNAAAVIAICGAAVPVSVDGKEVPMWSRLRIDAGQKLMIGFLKGPGIRCYLAVKGGFPNIPLVFGSKATTPSLKYGGTQGRQVRAGDYLELSEQSPNWAEKFEAFSLPVELIPDFNIKEVYVMQGPHDSADIMTAEDREMLYNTLWRVGHNSNRTGIKLIGPAPKWARSDGGEAGSHPSNYLDFGYPSPGGMNWGGDASTILAFDSPNFGGLICSSTVVTADLWKLGQLRPDDKVALTPISLESALKQKHVVATYIKSVENTVSGIMINGTVNGTPASNMSTKQLRSDIGDTTAILKSIPSNGTLRPRVVYRQGGDAFILVEFGEQSADIGIVSRIRLLVEKLELEKAPGLLLTPHIGCLTIEYEPEKISQSSLLSLIDGLETSIEANVSIKIPCREIRLPVVLDHPAINECIQRYMDTTRNKAVYLPDNVEYLKKANAMESRRQAFEILTKTEFVVVAVGFLCGAPMLFPLAPKAFLAQKYNPTRVSTPGGTVGVGGSILSLYPIEQPGGYMMLARTLEMFDPFGNKPGFTTERPWVIEPYDLIKFDEVSVEEYDRLDAEYQAGQYEWDVREGVFDVEQAYSLFQAAKKDPDVMAYKDRQLKALNQQAAIEKTLYEEWMAETADDEPVDESHLNDMLRNSITVAAPMAANVWKVEVAVGDTVEAGHLVTILEAMKMEINVYAPTEAKGKKIKAIIKKPGTMVNAGDVLMVFE
ncbi:urea carboxylase [Rhizodiscina lignyota]|uniref:Urea carboxylase n=1 Tax=Rhizodiscina lignyota TaxID=1504668 RepID=A0A9P4I3H3_9PEZI|nr:urea carboxylase [Rhizodiscina lignyota]